jgi:predicted 2-oxoglutarate/Fe(II)-dependent dioxygenase YbiX
MYASKAKYARGDFVSHADSSFLYEFNNYTKEIEETASYLFGVPLAKYDGNGLLNKWSVGDSLVKHVDAPTGFEQFLGKNIKDPPSAILYSSIVYLNDDYKGGDIHFTGHNVTVSPTAGSLLLFPATSMYPHEVKEITLGNRYTFTLFLSNPDIINMFRRLFSIAEQAHNEKRNDEK